LTKRFLAASAAAVVTTKMIKTREGSPETPTLIVALAVSLGSAAGAQATPVYLGRLAPRAENSPTGIG
jgi:hypothetical protein